MESIQALVQSSLGSIVAVQTLAVACVAGLLFMRDFNQLVNITLGALAADAVLRVLRQALGGDKPVDQLLQTSWGSFLGLPMGAFLATFISFGLVIALTFSAKSALKKF